jgi:hypothetical protein
MKSRGHLRQQIGSGIKNNRNRVRDINFTLHYFTEVVFNDVFISNLLSRKIGHTQTQLTSSLVVMITKMTFLIKGGK